MYAVVVRANIGQGQFESARKALRETTVPRASQAPGFVKGYWSAGDDRGNGLSFVVFKTREDAENAVKMIRSNAPPAGVTLADVEVREIVADA